MLQNGLTSIAAILSTEIVKLERDLLTLLSSCILDKMRYICLQNPLHF
jgi:hypothetical protein